jgi:hypothetical protein
MYIYIYIYIYLYIYLYIYKCIHIGPALLFPLLQAASSGKRIEQSLQLLHIGVKGSISNQKYMMTIGYKIVAFLLSLKNRTLIDKVVLKSIFQLCLSSSYIKNDDRGDEGGDCNEANKSIESLLLADSSAAYYLLLNYQIWDCKRFSYALEVSFYLQSLVSDELHGDLNSRRLASLGEHETMLIDYRLSLVPIRYY